VIVQGMRLGEESVDSDSGAFGEGDGEGDGRCLCSLGYVRLEQGVIGRHVNIYHKAFVYHAFIIRLSIVCSQQVEYHSRLSLLATYTVCQPRSRQSLSK
jgi:hypothetical protein